MMITKFRINSLILFIVLPIVLFCGNFSFGIENKTKEQISIATSTVSVELSSSIKYVSLSLKDSIVFALRNNFDIEISKLNAKKEDYNITAEKAKYDPTMKLAADIQNNEVPISS